MNKMFEEIVDLIFILADGSELLCKTTLSPEILKRYGCDDVDSFIDLSTMKIIPEDMFNYDFHVETEGTYELSALDALFQNGGKIHWSDL